MSPAPDLILWCDAALHDLGHGAIAVVSDGIYGRGFQFSMEIDPPITGIHELERRAIDEAIRIAMDQFVPRDITPIRICTDHEGTAVVVKRALTKEQREHIQIAWKSRKSNHEAHRLARKRLGCD